MRPNRQSIIRFIMPYCLKFNNGDIDKAKVKANRVADIALKQYDEGHIYKRSGRLVQ